MTKSLSIFTNGHWVGFDKWSKGYRIETNAAQTKTKWELNAKPNDDYQTYWAYLEQIFLYAGTASLSKEMKKVSFTEMEIGDVLIQGGFPGHAVMVVDMAINPINGKKYYLLGQSYMPAQEFQVLTNPQNPTLSPWYELKNIEIINTPEWQFDASQLRRFNSF